MLFHIEDDTLTITLEGAEMFWALKRKLVVPKLNIERVIWHEGIAIPRRELGFRIGAAIPGVLFAGHFLAARKNFIYLRQAQGLLRNIRAKHVLDIDLRDYRFDRLLLTVDNPDIAEQIIAWWSGNV